MSTFNKVGKVFWGIMVMVGIIAVSIMFTSDMNNRRDSRKGQENYCIRTLVEEDYIAKDCDKYFLEEDWYKNYMNNIEKDYEKIERESEE